MRISVVKDVFVIVAAFSGGLISLLFWNPLIFVFCGFVFLWSVVSLLTIALDLQREKANQSDTAREIKAQREYLLAAIGNSRAAFFQLFSLMFRKSPLEPAFFQIIRESEIDLNNKTLAIFPNPVENKPDDFKSNEFESPFPSPLTTPQNQQSQEDSSLVMFVPDTNFCNN
jgi:hypothetical protein